MEYATETATTKSKLFSNWLLQKKCADPDNKWKLLSQKVNDVELHYKENNHKIY